jgi:hypothetical protein
MARTMKEQTGVRESAITSDKIQHEEFKQAVRKDGSLLVIDLAGKSAVAPGAYLTTEGALLSIGPKAYAGDGEDGDWSNCGFAVVSKQPFEVLRLSQNPEITLQDARQIASKASLTTQF